MRTLDEIPRRLVIAIGGNAVHPEDIRGTSDEQKDRRAADRTRRCCRWPNSTTSW